MFVTSYAFNHMPAHVSMLLFAKSNRGSEDQKEVCWEAIPNQTINPVFITVPFATAPQLPVQLL